MILLVREVPSQFRGVETVASADVYLVFTSSGQVAYTYSHSARFYNSIDAQAFRAILQSRLISANKVPVIYFNDLAIVEPEKNEQENKRPPFNFNISRWLQHSSGMSRLRRWNPERTESSSEQPRTRVSVDMSPSGLSGTRPNIDWPAVDAYTTEVMRQAAEAPSPFVQLYGTTLTGREREEGDIRPSRDSERSAMETYDTEELSRRYAQAQARIQAATRITRNPPTTYDLGA